MKINERSCGSENKKDLGEDTSRGEITKGGRSGDIVVGGLRNHDHLLSGHTVEVYRARKLLMRHLIVVLELTLHVNRCSLARATGPVFLHGSFCLMKVNGRLRGVRGGTIKFLDPLYETQ